MQTMISESQEMLTLIEVKKNGSEHTSDEINWLINNLKNIPEYQVAAWLMAVYFHGLSERETLELTRAMAYSGHVLTLKRHQPGYNPDDPDAPLIGSRGFVDKHSTGGVGDKVSLALSPVLAALGFKVSKFSGRSLGHTGGTIDKLEAIPGFRTDISMKQFEKQIADLGIALGSQSLEFAPADKILYSLRDRTGTVDSIPLIASSVMSKKVAGGADIILLDVKVGSGAFMKNFSYAKKLAKQMVQIGNSLHLNTKAIISNMDQPLGFAVGNALEMQEAIELLEGKVQNDFYELVLELAGSIANLIEVKDAIHSGKAYVKLQEWISAQGGSLEAFALANIPKYKIESRSNKDSWIKHLDAYKVGVAIHKLGYKLQTNGTYAIDNTAGVWFKAKVGDRVKPGDLLFTIQGSNEAEVKIAEQEIIEAYAFSDGKTGKPKLVYKRI
jgi:pyrimidine-nucleoside phosphorylase